MLPATKTTQASADRAGLLLDVLHGLSERPKSLPCKYLYDARGSELFDRICELPEYYPTRTEIGILQRSAAEMAALLGPRCLVVEPGCGNCVKTCLLLDHLRVPAGYVPIDVAARHLAVSASRLRRRYPRLRILPQCADFTMLEALSEVPPAWRTVIFFPGSTIGNFSPPEAAALLHRMARLCGRGGRLLIGVDLKKDPSTLERAYNDGQGVTAAFNLNILHRINRELGTDFRTGGFRHLAFYDDDFGRIEMHLVSLERQAIHLNGRTIPVELGETIHTECSYKYHPDEFIQLCEQSGWQPLRLWMDPDRLFSVHLLMVGSARTR